jgi:hypothetical protein
MPRLKLDRKVDAERRDERPAVDAGGDRDGWCREASRRRRQRPPSVERRDGVHPGDADVDQPGHRGDRGLRLTQVPVVGAPRPADDRCRPKTRDEVACLRGRDDPRGNARSVLDAHVRLEPLERPRAVGDEEVAARCERERDGRLQALFGASPPGERFRREEAVDRRAPLEPDAARLDPRLPLGDARPLEDEDTCATLLELERDRQPDDPGADHQDVGRSVGRGHSARDPSPLDSSFQSEYRGRVGRPIAECRP